MYAAVLRRVHMHNTLLGGASFDARWPRRRLPPRPTPALREHSAPIGIRTVPLNLSFDAAAQESVVASSRTTELIAGRPQDSALSVIVFVAEIELVFTRKLTLFVLDHLAEDLQEDAELALLPH